MIFYPKKVLAIWKCSPTKTLLDVKNIPQKREMTNNARKLSALDDAHVSIDLVWFFLCSSMSFTLDPAHNLAVL